MHSFHLKSMTAVMGETATDILSLVYKFTDTQCFTLWRPECRRVLGASSPNLDTAERPGNEDTPRP